MGVVAERWLTSYRSSFPTYSEAAERASHIIGESLISRPIAIHLVTGRAKNPESAANKVRDKSYGRPSIQMTDVIGVRVITTYAHDVSEVVDRLRSKYEVDEGNSIDKTSTLTVDRFGYRGVHLVLRLGKTGELGDVGEILDTVKIEVQIRSVLEHAWAEIEHELRYKSGITFAQELSRRFNAVAGALEIVDREFSAIELQLVEEITVRSQIYAHTGPKGKLDSVGLLAFFKYKYKNAARLGPHDLPLSLKLAGGQVRQLIELGVNTVEILDSKMSSSEVVGVIRNYSDLAQIEPDQASALVRIGALVGLLDLSQLQRSSIYDSALEAALRHD